MSSVLGLQQKLLEALQEQNNLLRENAHLRLQLERRDMRIRDLEREVAELREARKGPSAYGAGVAGSAGLRSTVLTRASGGNDHATFCHVPADHAAGRSGVGGAGL